MGELWAALVWGTMEMPRLSAQVFGHGWEGSVAAQSTGVQTSASHREMVPLQFLMGFVPAGRSSSAISSFASDSLM